MQCFALIRPCFITRLSCLLRAVGEVRVHRVERSSRSIELIRWVCVPLVSFDVRRDVTLFAIFPSSFRHSLPVVLIDEYEYSREPWTAASAAALTRRSDIIDLWSLPQHFRVAFSIPHIESAMVFLPGLFAVSAHEGVLGCSSGG